MVSPGKIALFFISILLSWYLMSEQKIRAILLKPIQQDIDTTKRRIDTILEACVDPGTALRELETLVGGVFDVLATELTH